MEDCFYGLDWTKDQQHLPHLRTIRRRYAQLLQKNRLNNIELVRRVYLLDLLSISISKNTRGRILGILLCFLPTKTTKSLVDIIRSTKNSESFIEEGDWIIGIRMGGESRESRGHELRRVLDSFGSFFPYPKFVLMNGGFSRKKDR